jgi:predicted AlkP superfamily pyrophosphatase or phosphodiesterase
MVRRLIVVVVILLCGGFSRQAADLRPTVILISFDGWRWDYHTRVPVPHLQRLMARGVHAEGLIPGFPSKTFPNHYSIATGLYPGHHGIVANTIWDDDQRRMFMMARRDEVADARWWGGEPIWVTAERAGQKTAPFFWPGSEAPIDDRRPSYWIPYDVNMPASDRVRRVLELLDKPAAERPTLLTLYFEDTDSAGHDEGPDSQAVRDATIRVDSYLGQLTDGLERRGLLDRVNLVVVSDHGMSATSTTRVVRVDDYISLDDVMIVDINPTLGLYPKPGKLEAVYRALRNAHPRLRVYRKAETPAHWHYRDHPRIPPIVGVVDDGWQIMRGATLADLIAGTTTGGRGQHGYDPRAMSMRGIFVAAGPAFRQGVTVPAFENVHIYNMLARVLGLTPSKNDGSDRVARRVLRN